MPAMPGVLRTTDDRMATEPSPRLVDIEALIAQSRASGLDIVLTITGTSQEFSPAAELTAYRVVQESLTNAGRHGIGPVEVGIDQNPELLAVTVTNRATTFGHRRRNAHQYPQRHHIRCHHNIIHAGMVSRSEQKLGAPTPSTGNSPSTGLGRLPQGHPEPLPTRRSSPNQPQATWHWLEPAPNRWPDRAPRQPLETSQLVLR